MAPSGQVELCLPAVEGGCPPSSAAGAREGRAASLGVSIWKTQLRGSTIKDCGTFRLRSLGVKGEGLLAHQMSLVGSGPVC